MPAYFVNILQYGVKLKVITSSILLNDSCYDEIMSCWLDTFFIETVHEVILIL